MSNYDLVIKNANVLTSSDNYTADIGIKDGKIVEIASSIDGDNVYDAGGKYVIPGGIDVHTHMDMPFGGTFSSDDFETGTKAAAIGGTTAIIDYAVQPQGKSLNETIEIWSQKAEGKAVIDYGFHLGVTKLNDQTREELPVLLKNGFPTFKVFMVYDGMRLTDKELLEILQIAKDHDGLVCVHAENYDSINYNINKLLNDGKTEPLYHAISRPQKCEAEATNRAVKLAEMLDAPIYIVHVSNQEAADVIAKSRKNGFKTMGETCPQYLLLSIENYKEENFNGAKYVMSPPLRDGFNNELLWQSLRLGKLQTVATDHCPFFMEQKRMGIDNFTKIPNGAPGVEPRMALIYNYGVNEGKISLGKFVELTSTNPAKIFGMYPKKGTIAVNSDADLVVFDPNKEVTLSVDNLHENVDYTPYEGYKVKGYPVATFSRGELIAENGEYVGKDSRGQLLKREKPEVL
ncbi:dihydropyrimidinase [Peptostreptococcus equinus]|uniref:Dihydropyrimidinase n=1 Tax=Peptostreptococcus equinus TaxID=3003601 RepID=A0ABY7JP27_9FIRM|nr:dihydropyrimidinase [Peptostreptococcus sp. CBA3647]WAW14855.1 dihydropyrimidinase [Peptostreptococcus sp. CBA3647]